VRVFRTAVRERADGGSSREVEAAVMPDELLSERERKAAVLLAYGHTNREVARELDVSVRTAEAERAHLMRKLGLSRRSELVQWALERGLLR
jgi:DNA-binding CsgD family transcriptional regulator